MKNDSGKNGFKTALSLFENVEKHITLQGYGTPQNEADIRLGSPCNVTFDDGNILHFRFETEASQCFWEIVADKEINGTNISDFIQYARNKGFYTENVIESNGTKWTYQISSDNNHYKIRYSSKKE